VLAAARELGVEVPGECAVIGYGDSPLAQAVAPKLTTFRHPDHEMAAEAARLLIEDIIPAPPDAAPLHALFKPSLIVRESC
jgi:DNA-binding LacI/PurR family transcriptional regulator